MCQVYRSIVYDKLIVKSSMKYSIWNKCINKSLTHSDIYANQPQSLLSTWEAFSFNRSQNSRCVIAQYFFIQNLIMCMHSAARHFLFCYIKTQVINLRYLITSADVIYVITILPRATRDLQVDR